MTSIAAYPTESLHPHPQADLVPWPEPDDYEALVADIEANGIQVPIDAMPDGTVLDGRTRLAIARALNLQEVPVRWVQPADPVAYMVRMAIMRRHLSPATRKALAARLMRLDPSRSDRGIAHETGLSHPTVSHVRAELEATGDVERVSTRTDSLGRQQPATKPEPPRRVPHAEQVAIDQAAMEAHLDAPDPWNDALADPGTVTALAEGLREAGSGATRVRRTPDPIDVITPAQAARFPEVAASRLSADLADAIYAVRTARLDPKAWAERVPEMRPEDVASLRSKVAHVRRWADDWDALLAPRPLSVVGGTK